MGLFWFSFWFRGQVLLPGRDARRSRDRGVEKPELKVKVAGVARKARTSPGSERLRIPTTNETTERAGRQTVPGNPYSILQRSENASNAWPIVRDEE